MIKVSRRIGVILLAATFVVGFCVVGLAFAGDNPSFVWDGPHLPEAVKRLSTFYHSWASLHCIFSCSAASPLAS